jgi:rubrerythrin
LPGDLQEDKMSTSSDIGDILNFAIAKEVEAYRFLKAMAGIVRNGRIEKLFDELAKEELEHKQKLELEVMKLGKALPIEEDSSIDQHEYILSEGDEPLDFDYKDILMLGMEKEEASFRTYVGLLRNANDDAVRELLFALAEEEVKHKLRFETEYNLLLSDE